MVKYGWSYYLRFLGLSIILGTIAYGSSGKIAGTVLSLDTGEALPGVNILIEGTSLGAATDIRGEYVILNVPPGDYTLRASAIGYTTVRVLDLRISLDQTTIQNFSLTTEILEGEEVIVVAKRPLVQVDLTATQKVTTSEEIKLMPVETFLGVLVAQAGVNQGADGALHIRGGRSNEVGYFIDGISVSNPFFTNSLAINISNKALEEMKVVSGAFNAEYGNAMSGIVNLQVKEGKSVYQGSLSSYTGDYLSKDTDLFMNIDDLDVTANRVIEGTLNGPVPLLSGGGRFTFNVSGRYAKDEGSLYGRREHTPGDSANFLDSDNWYIELGGDNEFVAMNPSEGLNLLGKLTYRLTPRLKISSQLLHSSGTSRSYVHAYKYNPDGTSTFASRNENYSLKVNHALSTKSFYEANVFVNTTDYAQYQFEPIDLDSAVPMDDAATSDDLVYDPDKDVFILQNSEYVPTTRIQGSPSSATFVFGGTQRAHAYRQSFSRGGKFDLTVQLTLRHEVKTGFNARLDHLEERNFSILYDNQQYRVPTILSENSSSSHSFYEKEALYVSAYLQDKIEYQTFIMNAGIRFDYFDPNSEFISDFLRPEGDRVKASEKRMVSPRLGVAFPITDRGILHFSYGHFYQMPTLRNLYLESIFGAGLAPTIGYSDLNPEKTVLYEFGFQQQLTDVLAVEGSIFYKDIRDLLALQSIRYNSQVYGPSSYAIYLNKDYGAVKGLTLSLTKRYDRVTRTSAFLDYSYQVSEGNSVTSGSFYFNALTGEEEEKRIVPLTWDQRQVLNATVTISEPNKWGISFIGTLTSGWPYTPTFPKYTQLQNIVPDPNSGRKPWQKNVNARIFRNFALGRVNYTVFAKIYNLFDARNERYVFDDTGRAGYTFVNQSSQETAEFISHYGEPGIHSWTEYQKRPSYYSNPRSVQVGFTVEF